MKQPPLGRTGLRISEFCLGTMTLGTQTSEAGAHNRIDLALGQGLTFRNIAEMYPTTPVLAENVGRTEKIIGRWLAKGGPRDRVVLATKVTGAGQSAVRDGARSPLPRCAAPWRGRCGGCRQM